VRGKSGAGEWMYPSRRLCDRYECHDVRLPRYPRESTQASDRRGEQVRLALSD